MSVGTDPDWDTPTAEEHPQRVPLEFHRTDDRDRLVIKRLDDDGILRAWIAVDPDLFEHPEPKTGIVCQSCHRSTSVDDVISVLGEPKCSDCRRGDDVDDDDDDLDGEGGVVLP